MAGQSSDYTVPDLDLVSAPSHKDIVIIFPNPCAPPCSQKVIQYSKGLYGKGYFQVTNPNHFFIHLLEISIIPLLLYWPALLLDTVFG